MRRTIARVRGTPSERRGRGKRPRPRTDWKKRRARLEAELHRDLDVPLDRSAQRAGRVRQHGRDLPEGGVAEGGVGATGVRELRVVEEVERLHAELVAEAAESRDLEERRVDVELPRP